MTKASDMAAMLRQKYNAPVVGSDAEEQAQVQAVAPTGTEVPVTSPSAGRRGRPRGSSSRTEEYRRVCFEARVSLIDGFAAAAARKGMTLHQAHEAALQMFSKK